MNKGHDEGHNDEIDEDSNNEREYDGGRRRDRRGRDRDRNRGRERDNDRDRGSNNRVKEGKKKEESDNDENGSNSFKFRLEALPDLLDKVKDMFLRDAAVTGELVNHELLDQSAKSSTTLNVSGKDLHKHKNSHLLTRSSMVEGDGESVAPLGEMDEFNLYIAQSLPSVLECILELLRGNPGPRDDAGTSGCEGYSLSPEYVIRVSEDGQVTANTLLNATELYRRRLLSELRYKFVLVDNGKAVTHSEHAELRHPSLIAEINQYFELRLLYEPTDLAVDIIAVNIGSLCCFKKGMIELFIILIHFFYP